MEQLLDWQHDRLAELQDARDLAAADLERLTQSVDRRLTSDVDHCALEESRLQILAAQMTVVEERGSELRDVRRKFHANGYNSSDYSFDSSSMDGLIKAYVLGTVLAPALWSGITRSASYSPPADTSTFGSSSGFGGGSFSTGGGFGGGSMQTGGGF